MKCSYLQEKQTNFPVSTTTYFRITSLSNSSWRPVGCFLALTSFGEIVTCLDLNYNDSKILQLPWILLFPLAVFLPLPHLFFASNSSALLLMNGIKTFTSRNYGVQLCTPFADSRFFPSVYAFHTDCCCHWKNKLNETGTRLTGETGRKQAGECWSGEMALGNWNQIKSPAAENHLAQMPRKYPEGEASQRGMTAGWFLLSLISFGVFLQVGEVAGWLGGPGKDF